MWTHHSTPKFNGDPSELDRFFDSVELLAVRAQIDDDEKIKFAILYGGRESKLWSRLAEARGGDFDEFKSAVFALYPGAEDDRMYTVSDLERVANEWSRKGISSKGELGEYYRAFLLIANFLKEKDVIDIRTMDRLYMSGFYNALLVQVKNRLAIKFPDHFYRDPYPLRHAHAAAMFILDGTPTDTRESTSTASSIRQDTPESQDFGNALCQIQTQMAAFTQAFASATTAATQAPTRMSYVPPVRTPAPYVPVVPTAPAPPSVGSVAPNMLPYRPNACAFCSEVDHFIRNCPRASAYIQEGKCIRDGAGKIVLPGAEIVPRNLPGRNLMERIDEWHRVRAPSSASSTGPRRDPPPHMSVNLVEVETEMLQSETGPIEEESRFEEVEEADDDEERVAALVRVFETEVRGQLGKKRKFRFDGVEVPRRVAGPARNLANRQATTTSSTPAVTTPSAVPTAPATPAPAASTSSTTPPALPKVTPPEAPSVPLTTPQYRYQAPIEDSSIAQSIVERTLALQFPVTVRELFAVAPDVRRAVKELIASKRVPATTTSHTEAVVKEVSAAYAEVFSLTQEGLRTHIRERITGADAFPLRVVWGMVEGRVRCACVLDSGAMVIVMRKDVWERTGLPLRQDRVMTMESANNARSTTLGLLPQVEIVIGGFSLWFKVQVVDNAPFQVLLGRLFFALTQCVSSDFSNGDLHILITDPNTGEKATIPMIARQRKELEEGDF